MEPQDAFVECLKESYLERQLSCEEQWPPVSGVRLVNLQLLEAEKKAGFRSGLPQHGSVSKVKRTPVLSSDLFKVGQDKKPVRKVVVEGHAGIGKTTLCTMLTEKWAKGEILTQFGCILFLPLNDQMIKSASSLSELLAVYHPDESICECAVQQMKRTRGKGVLFIADGWDELDEEKRSKESFLYNLLFGRLLPSASVLLTSRPSASAPLHNLSSVERLVEVVGFDEESIKQYIESEFEQCPQKACSLIEHLASNPLILSVCTVPLNCAIVCNLWYAWDKQFPTTQTELYAKIVLNVIFRNLKKTFPGNAIGLSLKNFDSIPEEVQGTFWLTCKFAYECLLKEEMMFSEDKLSVFFPQGSNLFLCCGLLQCARFLQDVGQGLSFHFLHLTFQEFLAALHLVTLPNEEKLKVVEAHAQSDRFAMVWRFVFGLGCKKDNWCSNRVTCVNNTVVERFVSSFVGTSDGLLLCHTALESNDESFTIQAVDFLNGHFSRSLSSTARTPHDCVAVFWALRHTSKCPEMELNMSGCSGLELKELTSLLSSTGDNFAVKTLSLDSNQLSVIVVNELFVRCSASFSSLRALSLEHNNLTDIPIYTPFNTLSSLSLSDNPLGVAGMQSLTSAVEACLLVNVEWMHLSNTLTEDSEINGALLTTLLQSMISHCPQLTEFNLSRNILSTSGAFAVVNSSPSFSVDLSETNIDTHAVLLLADSVHLESSSKLTLDLSDNPLEYDGLLAILRMLRIEDCPITSLSLENTRFTTCGSRFQKSLPTALQTFGSALFKSRLTYLNVSRNDFSSDKVVLLAECVRVCQSLETLDCASCCLTSHEIKTLVSHLKRSRSFHKELTAWFFWYNSIDDEGVDILCESLPELFSCLKIVLLDFNPVSDVAKTKLRTCLKTQNPTREEYKRNRAEETAKQARRSAVLTKWERTRTLGLSKEVLSEFLILWDELLWLLNYEAYVRSKYPHLYGFSKVEPLPQIESRPASPSDDESFHSATEEPDEPVEPTPTEVYTANHQFQHSTDPLELFKASESVVETSGPQTVPIAVTTPSSHASLSAPPELTLSVLNKELKTLTKPIPFGVCLGIPQDRLEVIQQDHRHDTDGQKIALFQYIAKNHKSLHITWRSIADTLLEIHAGNLSLSIREKYCCGRNMPSAI